MRFPDREPIPAITGVGMAVPDKVVTNEDIGSMLADLPADRVVAFGRLLQKTGLRERHWVERGKETSGTLSVLSARQALEMAGVAPKDLKKIVIATHTPTRQAVPVAAEIQNALGIPTTVFAHDLGGACAGWGMALRESFADLTSPLGTGGPQLQAGTEVISLFLSPRKRGAFMLFGDASGATVTDLVVPDKGAPTNYGFAHYTDGAFAEFLKVEAGGSLHGTTAETVANDMHSLDMDLGVKNAAIKALEDVVRRASSQAEVPIEGVPLWVFHQANLDIIRGAAEALGIPLEKTVITIDRFGNTSSATIPTTLRVAHELGMVKRNSMFGYATFGAGFVATGGIIPMVGWPRGPKEQFEGVDVPKEEDGVIFEAQKRHGIFCAGFPPQRTDPQA